MADDDAPGGSPACLLDEVAPAYAGYLTDAELGEALARLLAHERAALALVRAAGAQAAGDPLPATLAEQFAAAERLVSAQMPVGTPPVAVAASAGFGDSGDSPGTLVQVTAAAAELVRELETLLPRIASNACHAALNQALSTHRDQLLHLPRR
jgi:hypothetical protein